MNNDQTSVDVVIPSYRPDEKFSRLVKKLQEQEYPIGTIFVINTKAGRFPKEVEQMEKVKVSYIDAGNLIMAQHGIWECRCQRRKLLYL